jgi:hypothetical protein
MANKHISITKPQKTEERTEKMRKHSIRRQIHGNEVSYAKDAQEATFQNSFQPRKQQVTE